MRVVAVTAVMVVVVALIGTAICRGGPPEARAGAGAEAPVDAQIATALAAALPIDGATDVLLVDRPGTPHAPRVRAATTIRTSPAIVKAILLDPGHYRAIIPGLIRAEVARTAAGGTTVGWELEVPLFNLEGHLVLRERPDGIEMDLFEGDLSPGRIIFTILPRPEGSALIVDAQLDVGNSTWLLRHIMARSPVGEPAALVASTYVALRAVALRAAHANEPRAWRPGAPPEPPAAWLPDAGPLAAAPLAPLRARGAVGLIARLSTERLGGVAVVVAIAQPTAVVAPRLRDPQSWRAFPGWHTVQVRAGAHGVGAEVEDNLPLADFDATWSAEPGALPRWTATLGATRGARLGWEIFPGASAVETLATLLLYPRLETTGRLARRSIGAEPLLEPGLSVALAFADTAAMKDALEAHQPR